MVWATKYGYKVLEGDLRRRMREIIRQVCAEMDVAIIKGVLSRAHVRLLLSIPLKRLVADVVQRMKGAIFPGSAARVPGAAQALLGPKLLGTRLLPLHGGKHH